jgi:hypothetical protein
MGLLKHWIDSSDPEEVGWANPEDFSPMIHDGLGEPPGILQGKKRKRLRRFP